MRALIVATLIVLCPTVGRGYPQFQFSKDAVRCNECHFSPSGGGLLNGFGRSEAGSEISSGGNGQFLHGLVSLPSWLALGGDVRVAGLENFEGGQTGVDYEAFPMQAELYVRIALGQFSLYLNGGLRGAARPVDPSFASQLISREHFLMWSQGETGWYARAGRFFAPFGLRLVEHTAYIRRFLGFNTLEEPYAVSAGYLDDDWELHLSAWVPDFVRQKVGIRSSGGAVYFERRVGSKGAWGAQAKLDIGDGEKRETVGAVGKLYLRGPEIQLLGELDLVRQSIDDISVSHLQLAGYLGGAWFFHRGWMGQLMLERWDEDLQVKGVARDALSVELQWFPTAHVELSLYARVTLIGTGGDDGQTSQLVLLQLHYYL